MAKKKEVLLDDEEQPDTGSSSSIQGSGEEASEKAPASEETAAVGKEFGIFTAAGQHQRIRYKHNGKVVSVGWKLAQTQVGSGRAEYVVE